jgi:hypothetical protein
MVSVLLTGPSSTDPVTMVNVPEDTPTIWQAVELAPASLRPTPLHVMR